MLRKRASLISRSFLVDELDVRPPRQRYRDGPESAERYSSGKVRAYWRGGMAQDPAPTMTKLLYYLTRDFIHLGKIEPLLGATSLIEDISCDGR